MAMEVQGKIFKRFDAQQITERFRKREFVLEIEDGRYPQNVIFQLTGNRCEALDDFQEGDAVRVEFNLRGREWTSPKGEVKYFNSLEVWQIEKQDAATANNDEPPPPAGPPANWVDEDDIPF